MKDSDLLCWGPASLILPTHHTLPGRHTQAPGPPDSDTTPETTPEISGTGGGLVLGTEVLRLQGPDDRSAGVRQTPGTPSQELLERTGTIVELLRITCAPTSSTLRGLFCTEPVAEFLLLQPVHWSSQGVHNHFKKNSLGQRIYKQHPN